MAEILEVTRSLVTRVEVTFEGHTTTDAKQCHQSHGLYYYKTILISLLNFFSTQISVQYLMIKFLKGKPQQRLGYLVFTY